jgi:hypothetical protein
VQENSHGHQSSATRKETVAVRTACNDVGSIPSERFGIREFLTHGPSPTPDPTRKVKGKGSEPLACEQRHSQDNVSIHLKLCSSVLAIMHGVQRRGAMGEDRRES